MSIPEFSNQMANFTDITDYVDYDGNGTGFELGKGGEILFYDKSSKSVVRAFGHGAMGRRIIPSWWAH